MVLLLGCLLALGAGAALAATYTVTNASDSGPGSLRDAIASAASGDTIQFAAGLDGQTITLATAVDAGAKNLIFGAAGGTVTVAGAALQGTGSLRIPANGGNLNFTAAVNFSGGLTVVPDTSPSISLADYTGGRVDLSGIGAYGGAFSGKLAIEGQNLSNDWGFDGGGLHANLSGSGRVSLLDGSLIRNNRLDAQNAAGPAYANGGGLYVFHNDLNAVAMDTLGGEIRGNAASATVTTATGYDQATAEGGGAYVRGDVTALSGKLDGNTATATATDNSGAARAHGGGAYIAGNLATLSGRTNDNTATAITTTQNVTSSAYAYGGGTYVHSNLTTLSGEASGNTATATADAANVYVNGGGVYVGGTFGALSGKVLNNTAEGQSASRNAYVNGGGLYLLKGAGELGGEISGNRAGATILGGNYAAYAYGGGAFAQKEVTTLSGRITGNTAEGVVQGGTGYAHVYGGGAYVMEGLGTLSGTVSGNTAKARNEVNDYYDAYAQGGGAYVYKSIAALSGTISNNTAEARALGGTAYAFGGGVGTYENITALSGTLSGNKAKATSTSGDAYARGGGAYVTKSIADVSGTITNNTVEASSGSGEAHALGGGLFVYVPDVLITKGTYANNKAIAMGSATRAYGGAIFLGADGASSRLVLDPTDGSITFSGNTVTTKANAGDAGTTRANAIHFGRSGHSNAVVDAFLTIQDSQGNNNLIMIADGITTDLNDDKTFTMAQSGGNFLWGGPNLFDSAGGNTVSLTGGTMRLMSGFALDRGAANGDAGLLAFTVTGGNLKSEGAATSLKHTALSVSSGGKLTVDNGSTLTLDASSTFALNNGTLGFGVGAGNASGLIDMTANITTAPTFAGSNTLDIATWIPGAYTVLKAGRAMGESASGFFSAFTVGGNAVGTDVTMTAELGNMGKDLLVTARLGRDNAELAWGGAASGAWNYTDANWSLSAAAANFLPKDAALLNGMGGNSHTITLGGTRISLSGLLATELDDYTLSGAALHIDSSGAQGAAVPALSYAGKLVKDGGGVLALTTGGAANPNRINTVELKNGNLKFGDGFALAPVSGRGSFTQTGGMLMLAGAVSISNYDLLLPGAFYMAPNTTLTLADSTLDKSSVALSMDEATLVSAGSYNTLNNTGLEIKNGGGLELRGNSVLTVADRPFSIISWAGGTATWRAGDSQLRLGGGGSLGLGVLDVDLNRSKTLAAIEVTGGSLALQDSTLRLRHTGGAATDGSWLIINGAYTDYNGATNSGESFQTLDIATATLAGALRNDPTQVWFDGTYTPLTPDGVAGLDRLPPNARAAAAGLLERVENGRGPVYDHLYGLSGEAFTNAVLGILPYASAEGAVSQGIQALSGHHAAAMAAFGYAFGSEALESSQSFAPLSFQAPNTLGFNIGSQNRRDQARLTGRYADRMASLDGNFGYGHSVYSVLGNWRPATDETRGLVASSSPEYALNAAASPNTPFGARIWGGYLGNFAHQDNKGGYAGYDSDQNGFLIGASVDLNPNWTVGAYAGWTTGETRYSGIRTRVDTDATHVGAFARYRREAGPGTVKVTGDILYSHTDNDSRRTVPTAIGDRRMKGGFDQNIWGGGLELAYDWRPESDPATVLTPYVAARYAHLDQDGFSESGDLGLKVDGTDADSFTTTLGIKAARDFAVGEAVILTPKATVSWLHQWADRDIAASSNFIGSPVTFMTRSVKQDTDAALLGAGLDVLIKTGKSWDLGLKLGYGADIRQNSNDQTVFAGFEIRF